MKDLIKRWAPEKALALIRSFKIARLRREFSALSMGATFSKIYRERLWGEGRDEFLSGSGSSGEVAEKYVDYVGRFIRDHGIESVVDLGCGDFRIGKVISQSASRYMGVDVVPELIAHHNAKYSTESIRFQCLDITEDDLPAGDLCLVRQVLQHLSNEEITSVLGKLGQYRYVLITEHFPPMNIGFSANKDKPHGPDTRVLDHSAVVLTEAPFSLQRVQETLSVDLQQAAGETIKTFLYSAHDDPPPKESRHEI